MTVLAKLTAEAFLKAGEKWDKADSSTPGIRFQILPATKNLPKRLWIRVNPVGRDGRDTKRTGVGVRDKAQRDALVTLLTHPKMDEALEKVRIANGDKVYSSTEVVIQI